MASYQEKAHFYSQLKALYDSGIPFGEALRLIEVQSLKTPLEEIRTAILQNGRSFGHALRKQKKHFTPLEIGLLTAGEETGRMVAAAENLANWFTLLSKARATLIGSLIYPMIILHAAPLLLGAPQLVSSNCLSCYLTTFLFSISPIYITYFIFFGALPAARKSGSALATAIDQLLLKLPLIGNAILNLNLARFSLALSNTIDSGIEIHRSLRLSIETTTNLELKARLNGISPAIKTGRSLTEALKENIMNQPIAEGFIRVGEVSGNNVQMLRKVHEYYFERFLTTMTRCTKVFPTLAFFIIAIIMGIQIIGAHSARVENLQNF